MYILSFDVGLVNISYTFIRVNSIEDWEIIDWNVFNIHGIVLDNNTVTYDETNYEFIRSTLKNKKIKDLKDILKKLGQETKIIDSMKRQSCVDSLQAFFKKNKVKGLSDLNVNLIIQRLCKYFDLIFSDILSKKYPLDAVIIENQPCLKNPKMKSIQIGLSTYFTMRLHVDSSEFSNTIVTFISASAKLSFCKKMNLIEEIPKNDYKKTKQLSVDVVHKLVIENLEKLHMNFDYLWKREKKHDDLTDVVLQAFAYFYLQNKIKKPKKI
jgi:hypothetical protein